MTPQLTPELAAKLEADLAKGDRTVSEVATKHGVQAATLRCWLSHGARLHRILPTLLACARLVRAATAGRERAARGEIAQVVVAILKAGGSMRAAAEELGLRPDDLRLIVERSAKGSPLERAVRRRRRQPRSEETAT